MHRAGLTNEARAVGLEDCIDAYDDLPEAVDRDGVVGGVRVILIEGNRLRYLLGQRIDCDRDPQRPERLQELVVEVGDRAGHERDLLYPAAAGGDGQTVIEEVEGN